jgi:hypothetical protein
VVDTPFGPGHVLADRFRLEDQLDETGGARFWRATDQTLARSVAVHVIPADDPRARALLTAARTSATVTDGHLLRVLDAAAEDDVAYIVNEWGNGVSLDRMLADGPLPPRQAAWVVREVAEAISIAHRHGVAHGRLLPENVMVTEAGSVKLIGFVVDAVLKGREHFRVTGGPELGEHEADVVNLGALLYAALVGRWPGTVGSVVPPAPADHGRPLRPRQVRAGVPRPLDAICDRVLNAAGHGATPIETAHEVYAALCDFIGDPGSTPMEPEPTVVLRTEDDPGPTATSDPAATQAGVPVFYDQDTGVGWMSGAESRGLRSDDAVPRRTPPPPPPHLPEPEPKPLFAPDPPGGRLPHRGLGPTGHPTRSTGVGNGALPDAWGPDADQPPPVDETGEWGTNSWDPDAPGRSWLRLAAVIAAVLVVVVAVVLAFDLGRRGSGGPTTPAATKASASTSASAGAALQIAHLSDFDPEQSGSGPHEENPDLVPLAVDGKADTAWQTLTYSRPNLGGLKSGVGLLVDLGKKSQVGSVRLKLIGSPTSVKILVNPDATSAPTTTDGMRTAATAQGVGTDADLKFDKTVTTQYLVVWLTSLPPYQNGYRGQVAEVSVRS